MQMSRLAIVELEAFSVNLIFLLHLGLKPTLYIYFFYLLDARQLNPENRTTNALSLHRF